MLLSARTQAAAGRQCQPRMWKHPAAVWLFQDPPLSRGWAIDGDRVAGISWRASAPTLSQRRGAVFIGDALEDLLEAADRRRASGVRVCSTSPTCCWPCAMKPGSARNPALAGTGVWSACCANCGPPSTPAPTRPTTSGRPRPRLAAVTTGSTNPNRRTAIDIRAPLRSTTVLAQPLLRSRPSRPE